MSIGVSFHSTKHWMIFEMIQEWGGFGDDRPRHSTKAPDGLCDGFPLNWCGQVPMLPLHPLYDRMKGVSPHVDGSPNDACPGHK